jgi:hypothetical protein
MNAPVQISIVDVAGRTYKEWRMVQSSETISVEDIENGIYFLKGVSGNKTMHLKILISKI